MLQQTPLSVIVLPPLDVTLPPEVTEYAEILVAAAVVTEGGVLLYV